MEFTNHFSILGESITLWVKRLTMFFFLSPLLSLIIPTYVRMCFLFTRIIFLGNCEMALITRFGHLGQALFPKGRGVGTWLN